MTIMNPLKTEDNFSSESSFMIELCQLFWNSLISFKDTICLTGDNFIINKHFFIAVYYIIFITTITKEILW